MSDFELEGYRSLDPVDWWKAGIHIPDPSLIEEKLISLADELEFVFSGYYVEDDLSYVLTRSRRREDEVISTPEDYMNALVLLARSLGESSYKVYSDQPERKEVSVLLGLEEGYSGESNDSIIHTMDEVRDFMGNCIEMKESEIVAVRPGSTSAYREPAVEIAVGLHREKELHAIAKHFKQVRYTLEFLNTKISHTFEKINS